MAVRPPAAGPRAGRRLGARCAALVFGTLVAVTDLLPPRLRYSYVHPLTRRLLGRPMTTLGPTSERPSGWREEADPTRDADFTCALITGSMDVGGIGSVVELLATTLPAAGVGIVVVCTEDGARAARLRSAGIEVVRCTTEAEARAALGEIRPAVIQLHGAPDDLENAAMASGIPLVPVLHNTEIHYGEARWQRFRRVLESSRASIAVSETVRAFHAGHVPAPLDERIHVVPNAVRSAGPAGDEERREARDALERALGCDLSARTVFLSLIRYDSQKNAAGLVSSFVSTVTDPAAHLVIAGDVWDWAELRRADAIRRSSDAPDRVSLLGHSDARALLAAADGFVLDSFFEGWPMAATEAAAMGLPLVLADFGGGRELVDRDPGRSVLVPNPSGASDAVSDAAVARARRRCRNQQNAGQLGAAVDQISARPRDERGVRPVPSRTLLDAMVSGHVDVLARAAFHAADDARPDRATQEVTG